MTGPAVRRQAPPVHYPVGRSRWLAGVLAAMALGGLAALLAWALRGAGQHAWWVVPACAGTWLAACLSAWRRWHAQPQGVLHWTGAHWELQAGPLSLAQARLQVHLDLQQRMGVCLLAPQGGRCWLWLESRTQPERWSALRRAVYSRASVDSADTATPPLRPDEGP